MLRIAVLVVAVTRLGCASPIQDPGTEDFDAQRARMVTHQLASRDITDRRVLEAMRSVPRHLFVPDDLRPLAYRDSPLPIGMNQTISQPYIVALMTQLAEAREGDRALEVGTGSGYQAAVLSRLVDQVYSIEIVEPLADQARKTLQELGYTNVEVRYGDGYAGWKEEAPFDVILVTAAAPRLPEPLAEQLAEGGRMVIPVGEAWSVQELMLYRKQKGELKVSAVLPVRFVPMTGKVQDSPP